MSCSIEVSRAGTAAVRINFESEIARKARGGNAAGLLRRHDPAAAVIISQGKKEHEQKPDEPGAGGQMEQAAAAFDVHEEENDEECFGEGNTEGDDEIKLAEVHIPEPPGEAKEQEKPEAG